MKQLLTSAGFAAMLLLCAAFSGCNEAAVAQSQNEIIDTSKGNLTRIADGSNFVVYDLKYNGNEYIIVNGINGVACVKHR